MLPILITVIVPEAVSSKRVIPVIGSLPIVSSTEPVICEQRLVRRVAEEAAGLEVHAAGQRDEEDPLLGRAGALVLDLVDQLERRRSRRDPGRPACPATSRR